MNRVVAEATNGMTEERGPGDLEEGFKDLALAKRIETQEAHVGRFPKCECSRGASRCENSPGFHSSASVEGRLEKLAGVYPGVTRDTNNLKVTRLSSGLSREASYCGLRKNPKIVLAIGNLEEVRFMIGH